jgi:uncharacterized membrane protein YuzA (DUF378 family)
MDGDSYGAHVKYMEKLVFKLAMVLLIVGGLNWLLVGLFQKDLVTLVFGKGLISRFIFVLVGIAAISIMFSRDTYLPFLGETVFPCSVLRDFSPDGATVSQNVQVSPHAKVLYWASEPENDGIENLKTYDQAYLQYKNAGVTTANGDGVALLKVRQPQAYKVPMRGRLEPHIHFRVCGPRGFLGAIQTIFLHDGHIETFNDYAMKVQ